MESKLLNSQECLNLPLESQNLLYIGSRIRGMGCWSKIRLRYNLLVRAWRHDRYCFIFPVIIFAV